MYNQIDVMHIQGGIRMTLKWMANGAEAVFKHLFDAASLKWIGHVHKNNPEKFQTSLSFETNGEVECGVLNYDLDARITNNDPQTVGMNYERWRINFKLQYDVNHGFSIESIQGSYSISKDKHQIEINLRPDQYAFLFRTIGLAVRQVTPPKVVEEELLIPTSDLISFLELDDQEKVPGFINKLGHDIGELAKSPEMVDIYLDRGNGTAPDLGQSSPTLS